MSSTKQNLLFLFLQNAEKENIVFNSDELATACGWSKSTFKTYWSKGQLLPFITEISPEQYNAINCIDLSFSQFQQKLSQSKHLQSLGHNFKSQLAKALLKKSKDNMMLAIEIYNRPSLENKLDAFVVCFCIAWEQLLKAEIIDNNNSEKAIYKNDSNKTLSIKECLKKIYPNENSGIRKNIEEITKLRDDAVHLLLAPLQGLTSRMFQSGVINYANKFAELTKQPFLDNTNGMLSLVGDFNFPPESVLKKTYGVQTATELLQLARSIESSITENNDTSFAIPLQVQLVYKATDTAGKVKLINASEGIEGIKDALIIEKATDVENKYPYKTNEAITKINEMLQENHNMDKLRKHLPWYNEKTKKSEINGNCFRAIIEKNNWKESNNEYHHYIKNANCHLYSDKCIEKIAAKIMCNKDYVKNAKNTLNKKNKLKKK